MPAGRQRRPSGAPPPLPRHIERSGYIWLAVAIVAVGGVIAVFAGGLSRWAVDVTVIDDAMTRHVASAPVPGFTAVARVIAEAGAAPATIFAGYALLLALIVLRRFRYLVVLIVSYEVTGALTALILFAVHRVGVSSVTMSAADCGCLARATPCPAHIESASILGRAPAVRA